MSALNKHQILGASDTQVQSVDVPEWGGTVFLRSLSTGEGIEYNEKRASTHEEKLVPLALTYSISDEMGKPLFNQDDVDELCKKDPRILLRLYEAALALNKMREGDDEVREKNS